LGIDSLDRTTTDPAVHFKDMIGWNRKALRITLPPAASAAQVKAVEKLCVIAAEQFAPAGGSAAKSTPPSLASHRAAHA